MGSRKHKTRKTNEFIIQYKALSVHDKIAVKSWLNWTKRVSFIDLIELSQGWNPYQAESRITLWIFSAFHAIPNNNNLSIAR